MERIVQMRNSEYKELYEKAARTDKDIQDQAKRLWRERGVSEIEITMKSERSYGDIIRIDCSTYMFDKDDKFQVPSDLRHRIADGLDRMVKERVTEMVGEPLALRNKVQKNVNRIKNEVFIFYAICFSGWGAFIGCLLYFLLR